ncbi:hypothetical protein JXX19_17475, partial [Ruthenibacterium lactatiformans]
MVSTMRYSRTLEGQKDKAVDVLDAEKTNGCTQTAKNFTSPNNKKAEKHQTSRLVACLNKKDILVSTEQIPIFAAAIKSAKSAQTGAKG